MASKAFAIVTPNGSHIHVAGLEQHRPISAFSFLGRYRIVDFPISSLSNSGISRIQVYCSQNPRSLAEHLGTGRHYNINSKSGKLQLLFNQDSRENDIYNTDVRAYMDNIDIIRRMAQPYVILTPGYMVFATDYEELLETHIATQSDITFLYHRANDAKTNYRNCYVLNLDRKKGVKTIEMNTGTVNECNIFMGTAVMSKELFIELIEQAKAKSSVYNLIDIINDRNEDLLIRGIQHKGYFAAITDFKAYYDANMELLDPGKVDKLVKKDWPIYTQTTDSSPVHYYPGSSIRSSMVANGSVIKGTVENSVIGRGVTIEKGAVVKNCVILGHSKISSGVHLEYQVVDKWARDDVL